MKFLKFWWNKFLISTVYIILIGVVYKFLSNETSKIIGTFLTTVFVWVMNKTFSIDYQTKNEKELKDYQGKIDKEMEDYKNEWNQKLEDYKNKLDAELETHKAKLSGYTLVTKLQFDLEFKIYTEMYGIFQEALLKGIGYWSAVKNIHSSEKTNESKISAENAYAKISNYLLKYRPFYNESIFMLASGIQEIYFKILSDISKIAQNNQKILVEKDSKFEKMGISLVELSALIRERIENMKIVE